MAEPNNYVPSEPENIEEGFKNIAINFGKALPFVVLLAIASWWVLQGMISITSVQISLTDRIGLTICTIALAVIYSGIIAKGGFGSAKETKKYKKHSLEWGNAIKLGNPHKKCIELYARDIAKNNQFELRVANLEANGLYYWDYFDEEGNFIKLDFEKDKKTKNNVNGLTRKQIRIIKKCIDIRIVIPTLFGNLSSKFFGVKREINQREYEGRTNLVNIIFRIILSFFTVGIMIKFIGFNLEGLIYSVLQLVIWTASGVYQRLNNYNFVMNKLLPQMVEKTLIIEGYLSLSEDKKLEYENRVMIEENKKTAIKKLTYNTEVK
jgi:hypothetical protein